ncbi:hypothetical protein ABTL68_19395, partial [Acinetobacter baumannii]
MRLVKPRLVKPRLNVTLKFIAYLILISVLPILATGLTSVEVAKRILRDQANRHAGELVTNQVDLLHFQMDQVESLIANISGE